MSNFIRLNTVLRPSPELAEAMIALSQRIAGEHEAHFALDGLNFFPHLTLYSPEYPENRKGDVIAAVKKIAEGTSTFEMRYVGTFSGKEGFVGLSWEYHDSLRVLHEKVVTALNPFREGHIRDVYIDADRGALAGLQGTDAGENIQKWGYPRTMNLYKPHMSILRLKDGAKAEQVANEIKWEITKWTAAQLGVYAMGEHGTCVEEVAIFDLQ